MRRNKDLKKFYQKVYLKGERKHYTHFVTKHTPTSEADEVLREVSWKNKKVLDVGCGTGNFALKAAKKGAKVLGIDFAEEAIKIARDTRKHKNLRFENLDVKNIKEKFDIIVSLGTLEHMDDPFRTLKLLKSHLESNGKIIITTPNWTNPRGYILMTLWYLFKAPVTLADLHYLTPIDHEKWAKKLGMRIRWRTIEKSWGHGKILIKDFKRRIPNVLVDARLPSNQENISSLINWLEKNALKLDNSLPHSGAVGLYIYSKNN